LVLEAEGRRAKNQLFLRPQVLVLELAVVWREEVAVVVVVLMEEGTRREAEEDGGRDDLILALLA